MPKVKCMEILAGYRHLISPWENLGYGVSIVPTKHLHVWISMIELTLMPIAYDVCIEFYSSYPYERLAWPDSCHVPYMRESRSRDADDERLMKSRLKKSRQLRDTTCRQATISHVLNSVPPNALYSHLVRCDTIAQFDHTQHDDLTESTRVNRMNRNVLQ